MADLNELMAKINKSRKNPIIFADDAKSPCVVSEWLETGCHALDAIMGGGLPVGRIVDLYGDTSTGKTLIAGQLAAIAQQLGHIVLYIDTERALSLDLMDTLGVDHSKLFYADPETIEDVFELMEDVVVAKPKDELLLIIWDSVAATTNKAELEGEYGSHVMGSHARLISQSLRKFNMLLAKHRACAIFLNQTRDKIGVMFGDKEDTFGGHAIKFYSSVRIRLKLGAKIKDGGDIVGINTRAQCVKNKVAMPFKEATLPIYFDYGIDDGEASFEYLKDNDILVHSSGGWYTMDGVDKKISRANWPDVYDEYFDDIIGLMVDG